MNSTARDILTRYRKELQGDLDRQQARIGNLKDDLEAEEERLAKTSKAISALDEELNRHGLEQAA